MYLAPARQNRWTIAPATFTPSLNEDVQRWLDRLGKADPEEENGPYRAARAVTIRHRAHQIYKAASALVLSSFPIEELTSLTILTQPDNFGAALKYLLKRQRGVPSDALFGLAGALRAIANHHLKAPQ